ncbi:hypothetical protein GCM10011509_34510 [Ornithinimicrobium pekingense]|uniref:Uncharacterized protein n=1 Tax=Ornithinimicrobium pekingense TaxID=384677 RepID=A0ABQ2FDN5_9MICO|nr:hypothetical protein GCM10011509_34510 [Ornithinimicrobium pekingense]
MAIIARTSASMEPAMRSMSPEAAAMRAVSTAKWLLMGSLPGAVVALRCRPPVPPTVDTARGAALALSTGSSGTA